MQAIKGFKIEDKDWIKFRTKALEDKITISEVIRTLLDMWYDGKIIIQEKNKT